MKSSSFHSSLLAELRGLVSDFYLNIPRSGIMQLVESAEQEAGT
jgi:hypothetical protein